MENLDLWNRVSKTNPKHTKPANVRGNKITAIAPQSQIMRATEEFGPYGADWGFKEINIDSSLMSVGLVTFNGVFHYPANGTQATFPIISSIGIYKDNAQTKIDDDFAKKVETDALTKALSKIGFNADVFMGMYDDHRYVTAMQEEFSGANKEELKLDSNAKAWIAAINNGSQKLEDITDPTLRKFIKANL